MEAFESNDDIVVHHVELAKTGYGLSGGEVCLIEVARYLGRTHENVVYVPEHGRTVYENNGLEAKYRVISSYSVEKRFGVIIAYLWRIVLVTLRTPRFDRSNKNLIISHSDFLPTVWCAWLMRLRNPEAKWIAFCHMLAPSPFKGYEGEFTGKTRLIPSVRLLLYRLSQKIFFFLAGSKADKAIFVNPYYKEFLSRSSLSAKSAIVMLGAKAYIHNRQNEGARRKYDGIFVGRFHPQKGIFDLVDICERIVDSQPDFRMAIVGSGTKRFEDRLKEEIQRRGLEANIDLLGYKEGSEKYDILLQGRVFLFPSYYESFGIVAIEAMRCGLPVVAYDLPVFRSIFEKGMVRVHPLDNDAFAKAVLRLLTDQHYYDLMSEEALSYSGDFTWERTGDQVNRIILSLYGVKDL